MCLLIINKKGRVLEESFLQDVADSNPHGLGVIWLDTWKMEKMDSYDYHELKSGRPYVAHFRYATVGKVTNSNIHPFKISDHLFLFQNGTIPNFGNKAITDTEHMARLLAGSDRKYWKNILELTDCRYAIVDTKAKRIYRYNKSMWFKRFGVEYSNDRLLDNSLIFVYGTLKKGFSNHAYMYGSKFVGKSTTVEKYPMVDSGIPYMYKSDGNGFQIKGEVYRVPKSRMPSIDNLEGHPTWYKRTPIEVTFEDGSVHTVEAYIMRGEPTKTDVFIDEFKQKAVKKYKGGSYGRYTASFNKTCDWCGKQIFGKATYAEGLKLCSTCVNDDPYLSTYLDGGTNKKEDYLS